MALSSPAARAAGALGVLGVGAAAAAHVWARHIEIHRYTLRELELFERRRSGNGLERCSRNGLLTVGRRCRIG